MRFSITLLIFLSLISTIKSQDLIVTAKGDSINCKITKVKSDYIYFTFKFDSEIRNTLLSPDQIKFYKKEFYAKAEVPLDKIKYAQGNYQKIRIGAFGGWSYLVANVSNNVPSVFKRYVQELKSGYHFGGDFTYFMSEHIGFGVKYSIFRTENELDNVYAVNNVTGIERVGKLQDDITIQYLGPTFCTRIISTNKKRQYLSNLSFGYLSYKNNATLIDSYTLKSGTLGLMWDLGVDFQINKKLALGLVFAYKLGTLNHYKYNDGKESKLIKLDEDNLEGISRIDISIGLKWNK